MASLSTQVPNPVKPKKFFKSRNTAPPASIGATPDAHRQSDGSSYGSPQQRPILHFHAGQLHARIAQDAGGSPSYAPVGYYQPLAGAAAMEAKAPTKKKTKKKKQKQTDTSAAGAPAVDIAGAVDEQQLQASEEESSSNKKEKPEKKEKKLKKAKKETELPPELPKRNSSRIRNKVVNYNEDDDSFDMIPYRDEVSGTPPVSKLALEPAAVLEEPLAEPAEEQVEAEHNDDDEDEEEEEEDEEEQVEKVPEEPEDPVPSESVVKIPTAVPVPLSEPAGMASPTKSGSGSGTEDRVRTREHREARMTVPMPLSSPSVTEHPPIVLRISKVRILKRMI